MPDNNKVSLLLDLDGTVMTALLDNQCDALNHSVGGLRAYIELYHLIHWRQDICHTPIKHQGCHIFIINPAELKQMIETIYSEGDDIIIFTAGVWDSALLALIAKACKLSEAACVKFGESILLNVDHDANRLGLPAEVVRYMNKAERLHRLCRLMPELSDRHYVLLDDNQEHVDACEEVKHVSPVLAATNTGSRDFYEEALKRMRLARHPSAAKSPLFEALSPGESDENLDPEEASAASVFRGR